MPRVSKKKQLEQAAAERAEKKRLLRLLFQRGEKKKFPR